MIFIDRILALACWVLMPSGVGLLFVGFLTEDLRWTKYGLLACFGAYLLWKVFGPKGGK